MSSSAIQDLMAQAKEHFDARRFDKAAWLYQRVLRSEPRHAPARAALGEIALAQGQAVAAESHFAAALNLDPSLVSAAHQLAIISIRKKQGAQALEIMREVLRRAPEVAEYWTTFGYSLLMLNQYEQAAEAFETAHRLRPTASEPLEHLAQANLLMIRLDRCLDALRRALAVNPKPASHSALLFWSLFAADVSPEQIAALAEAWDARYAAPPRTAEEGETDRQGDRETRRQGDKENRNSPITPPLPVSLSPCLPVSLSLDPNRPLRIGYVAPTFRRSSVGLMAEAVLAAHDRTQFIVHCYSDVDRPDDTTKRYQGHAQVFRETAHLSDEHLTQLIRRDQIDVLVDLNLHMDKSRLGVFARRAAPVQASYLAYPFTCGVKTMDYRVTDAILDPPGAPTFGPEALLRLRSCYWLYRPNPAAPEPAAILPARTQKPFSFASFNHTQKLNPQVAGVWARIVNRVPGSRLLLVAEEPISQRPYLARLFSEAGLDPARLAFMGILPIKDYLAGYHEVDLCLDPFPYGGHTTTLDALWMGVPVVTLAGQVAYARGATSMLTHLRLPELIADNLEKYEEIAVRLASDLEQLETHRLGLRKRVSNSILCDEAAWVADYERCLRLAWIRHGKGLQPAEITLSSES